MSNSVNPNLRILCKIANVIQKEADDVCALDFIHELQCSHKISSILHDTVDSVVSLTLHYQCSPRGVFEGRTAPLFSWTAPLFTEPPLCLRSAPLCFGVNVFKRFYSMPLMKEVNSDTASIIIYELIYRLDYNNGSRNKNSKCSTVVKQKTVRWQFLWPGISSR